MRRHAQVNRDWIQRRVAQHFEITGEVAIQRHEHLPGDVEAGHILLARRDLAPLILDRPDRAAREPGRRPAGDHFQNRAAPLIAPEDVVGPAANPTTRLDVKPRGVGVDQIRRQRDGVALEDDVEGEGLGMRRELAERLAEQAEAGVPGVDGDRADRQALDFVVARRVGGGGSVAAKVHVEAAHLHREPGGARAVRIDDAALHGAHPNKRQVP